MRTAGIVGVQKRKFRLMPREDVHSPAPNLLKREFDVDVPNAVWAGDMTYLWTPAGWVFLAVVLDLFSRRVVGWAISRKANSELMIDAMARAVYERQPKPGLVSHSDQGCQYTSISYGEFAKANGILLSMSRRGNPWDNAVSEAFFATLKAELGDSFISFDAAQREVFEYIEGYYNTRRIHTSIGWMSPMQYENRMAEVAA
jgi:transposase InsO family protein